MKHITFYLDFVSPYAYLAFEELPNALVGLSYSVTYTPVFLGGLLKHHGQRGPAEIPAKRDWIYRHVQWLARSKGLAFSMPTTHPFNSLGLLRLAVASNPQGLPNRYVCETLLRHVWAQGGEATDPARMEALSQALAVQCDLTDPSTLASAKAQLLAHSDAAIAQGVFGVPAFVVDGQMFWGLDALPMLRSYLETAAPQDALA